MAMQQRRIIFAGQVQGVGFRFTACRVAAGYDLGGYVRNLPDGRVECVVEGDAGAIDGFVAELGGQMSGYVRDRCEQTAPHTGQLTSFTVRF